MKFRDIAIKNFKNQIKRYISYFLCNSFSVMIFFIYSTLLFNDNLRSNEDYESFSIIFIIGLVAVGLFAVFFINYAHSSFVKSRNKEFGVYMTLGMSKKNIRSIVMWENLIIILLSMAAGLITGLVFSRLFQMIVLSIMDIEGIEYSLSYQAFIATTIVFALVSLSVIAISNRATRKIDISDLLKKSRRVQFKGKNKVVFCFLGLVIILSSFVLLYLIAHNEDLRTNNPVIIAYFLISFFGVYITISSVGKTIISLVKRNKKRYYKNILITTEVGHKFEQHKRIIFVLSVLSSMIVFLVASPFSLYSLSKNIVEMSQKNHLEFAQVGDVNDITIDELNNIFNQSGYTPTTQNEVEFISLKINNGIDKYDLLESKPIVSQKSYNRIIGSNIQLNKGEALNIITAWEPGYHGIEPGSTIVFEAKMGSYEFLVKDSTHSTWITSASTYPSSSGIVVSDKDYKELENKVSKEFIGSYHIFNFDNWEKTIDVVNNIKLSISDSNSRVLNSELFKVASRIEAYEDLKRGYSLFIFITTAMGLLFFIAAGSILYFKQYTEITSAKEKFTKLFRIGITKKEIITIISKELKFTFFMPLIFGSILGYSFIYFMTFWVGGGDVIKEFIQNATIIVIAYFVFQALFYYLTKKKYASEIIDSLYRQE